MPTAACCSLQWVFCVGFSRPVSVLCRFLCLLNCISKDLTCPLYALLISVSIHPQCDRFVRMTQLFRYTGNVRSVGDGDAGKAVPKLVGMQTLHTIFLCKVLQVTGRTLGMYRLGAAFLGKYILADGFLALLKPKLTQQRNDLWVYINGAVSSILWGDRKSTRLNSKSR